MRTATLATDTNLPRLLSWLRTTHQPALPDR